jgi:minor histocompatibility antigen H13
MMTVATKVEAPVKFIFTAPPSDSPRDYEFSVLGLGDVVIPGLFVSLMEKADEVLQPKNISYFNVAVVAYAVGLAACFTANEIYHNGQPALLYLDPALLGSTLLASNINDQVTDLWAFKEEEEEDKEKVA